MRSILLCLSLCLTACASSPVMFYDRLGPEIPPQFVTSIYLDKYGDIYSEEDRFKSGADARSDAVRCTNNQKLCESRVYLTNEKTADDAMKGWRKKQDKRWNARAESIVNEIAASGKQRPIVMLIHGFRVEQASPDYDLARIRIDELNLGGPAPYYIDVNWDGRSSSMLGIQSAWGRAQMNGPQSGFRLRRLLNLIDQKYTDKFTGDYEGAPKIRPQFRILTHSSGAFVAAAIVGDSGGSLPCMKAHKFTDSNRRQFTDHEQKLFNSCTQTYVAFERSHRAPVPEALDSVPSTPDIRLGMMAPAMAATAFTGRVGDKNWPGDGLLIPSDSALLIGYNPEDSALRKKVGPISLPTHSGGESGLGTTPKQICRVVGKFQSESDPHVLAIDLNRRGRFASQKESHDFRVYLNQPEFEVMAGALMGETLPPRMTDKGCVSTLEGWTATARSSD